MDVRVKRIYEEPRESDGVRILVDRLWPRGVSREKARIDVWAKEIAPSNELRGWYGHALEKWPQFRRRYSAELDTNGENVSLVFAHLKSKTVTLLYSSRETTLNNATALKEYLESRY